VIAVEFAHQLDPSIRRLEIAIHHHRSRDDHRFAQLRDRQLNEAAGRVDLAARGHLCDHLRTRGAISCSIP